MCGADQMAYGPICLRVEDISSVTVTCRDCGRSLALFPNDGSVSGHGDKPASAYLARLRCSQCRRAGDPGRRLILAPVWRSRRTEDARRQMARLYRT